MGMLLFEVMMMMVVMMMVMLVEMMIVVVVIVEVSDTDRRMNLSIYPRACCSFCGAQRRGVLRHEDDMLTNLNALAPCATAGCPTLPEPASTGGTAAELTRLQGAALGAYCERLRRGLLGVWLALGHSGHTAGGSLWSVCFRFTHIHARTHTLRTGAFAPTWACTPKMAKCCADKGSHAAQQYQCINIQDSYM